jgi:hypothetical protein
LVVVGYGALGALVVDEKERVPESKKAGLEISSNNLKAISHIYDVILDSSHWEHSACLVGNRRVV